MEIPSRRFRSLIFFALFLCSVATADSNSNGKCVYTLYVKTGSIIKAGTNSKISIEVDDEFGRSIRVSDLEEWGMMGPNYDYYEWDDLDIFSGRGPCVGSPLCRLNITSDGSGSHHGWYCNYVEVTSTGPHQDCSKTIFYVQQWLANDAPPYRLNAVVDGCGQQYREKRRKSQPFVVKNDYKDNTENNDDHKDNIVNNDDQLVKSDHSVDLEEDHEDDQDHGHLESGGSDAAL